MANIDRVIDELNAKIALKKQADREAKVAEQNQLREAQVRKDTANVTWTKTRSTLAKSIEEINGKLSGEVALKLGDAENSTNSLILLQQYVVFAQAPARQSSLLKLIFTPKLDGETLVTLTGRNKYSEKHPSSTIGKNEIDSLLARLLLEVELG